MEVSHNSHCICHHLLWVQVMYWLIATVTKTTALSFCMLGSTWKSDLLPEEIPIPRWLTTCVLRAAPLNVPSLQTAPFKIACLNAATNTTLSILFSWKFVWVVMDGNWGGTVKTYPQQVQKNYEHFCLCRTLSDECCFYSLQEIPNSFAGCIPSFSCGEIIKMLICSGFRIIGLK